MEKINIAEILKDCPKGMELYSPIFGEVYLDKIRPHLAIVVTTDKDQGNFKEEFLYDGRYGINGECMLFPSKDQKDWSKFHRPFQDGDILTNERGSIFIYKGPMYYNKLLSDFYCGYRVSDEAFVPKLFKDKHFGDASKCRFATEKEKQKLLTIIRENGYNWDPETKILEKLIKFKVGDRIQHKSSKFECTLGEYSKGISAYRTNIGLSLTSKDLEQWELAPHKFDITTLKPFDKVLVRQCDIECWKPALWGRRTVNKNFPFITSFGATSQAIPFKNNEWLVGTTDDCNDYYKTWM